LDLVFSLAKEQYEGIQALLTVYLIPYLPILFEAISRMPDEISGKDITKVDTILRELIVERIAISGIPTPMLLVLRAMFINDLFSNRLVVTDWVTEYTSNLLRIRDFPFEDLKKKFGEIFKEKTNGKGAS
jgi:hypothetical protein